MFIERGTSKRFLLAPAERNKGQSHEHLRKTLRSFGAKVIGFRALSINISLLWSETIALLPRNLNSPNIIFLGLFRTTVLKLSPNFQVS
jgi:hypothetical protein